MGAINERGWRGVESGYHNSSRKKDANRERATSEDRKKYMDAWAEMMITIWRERIQRLQVYDTNLLRGDITENVTSQGEDFKVIQHKFLEYGIYQDCGVGRGYERGNGGNLEFLDARFREKEYTRKQKSGKVTHGEPRQPREWFSRPYFASVMVLKEQMAYSYGEQFCFLVKDAIEYNERIRGTSLRNRLWGTRTRKRGPFR